MYNFLHRLEPYNKIYDLADGVQACVKDPLWLLGRQWQLEEFLASNGGVPVRMEAEYLTQTLNSIVLGPDNATSKDISNKFPLEMYVEQESATALAPAWDNKHLEYNFRVKNLTTELAGYEYDGEKIDWYTFSLINSKWPTATPQKISIRPHNIRYNGMPAARWWTFEDGNVNLNAMKRPYCNILTMMLIEFSLIYSQDWYMLPIKHQVGDIRKITTVRIVDSFGIVSEAKPVTDSSTLNNGFEVFTLAPAEENKISDGTLFYFPNNLQHALESKPIEEVNFVRDEMSNMVWAIEDIYSKSTGEPINRHDDETPKTLTTLVPEHYWDENNGVLSAAPAEGDDAASPVPLYLEKQVPPRYWIPYVQQLYHNAVVLRRARTYTDAVQYLGKILEQSPLIAEEEITNVGIKVLRTKQLARATDGKTVFWKGRKKRPSQILTASNLQFDQLVEPKG